MMGLGRAERDEYVLAELTRTGSVSVAALAKELGVSEVTVRGQLRQLEERGLLTRTHGGAESTSVHNVLARRRLFEQEKDRIARAAAELVQDGDTIMVEAGTTTAQIVRHLASRRGVQIVTNSTLVFSHARHNLGVNVILTGGSLHRPSESLVGAVALRAIRDFHVRIAFVGTEGFTARRGLTTAFSEGAEVILAMHEQADETWLVADASKHGQAGFVRVLDLPRLAGVITDDRLDEASRHELSEQVGTLLVV